MSCYVSVLKKGIRGRSMHWVKVDPDVSLYIKQLEAYIRYPDLSKLKEAYPGRFNNFPDQTDTPDSIIYRLKDAGGGVSAPR